MVLVDVDSYLEDEALSHKSDESLERMFAELLETTRKPPKKKRTKEPKSHTQIAASYCGGTTSSPPGGMSNSALKHKKKRSSSSSNSSSSKSKTSKSSASRASSSHAVGALLSLPTIDELSYNSDAESIERITRNIGDENSVVAAESSLLSDIVWDAKHAVAVTSSSKAAPEWEKDGVQRSSSILNDGKERNLSPQPSTRKGVRFGGVHEIEVEPWYQTNTASPELERPRATLVSRRKDSDGSTTSSDDSSSSQGTVVPELQQIAQQDAEAAPSCLDLYAASPPSTQSERRSSDTDTSLSDNGSANGPAISCFQKTSPRKLYRQCVTYLLALLLLGCSVTLLTVAVKVVQRNRGDSSSLDASNTTDTGGMNPPTTTNGPVVPSIATPMAAPTSFPTRLAAVPPTLAPVLTENINDTSVREPLIFLNCGGPSIKVKSRLWEADGLFPHFILDSSRTKGRATDPLCQEYVVSPNSTNEELDRVRPGDFDALFCSERFFPARTGGRFEIPVPAAGEYRVELYFFEDYHTLSRQRVFNISVEDELTRENYDIFLRAGGVGIPDKVVTTIQVDDGAVSVSLVASIGNPTINALAVYQIVEE